MKDKNTTKLRAIPGTVKPLPSIYISKGVSDDRKAWFNRNKYDKLNQTAQNDGALSEIQDIYIRKAEVFSKFIDEILSASSGVDGLRIYFGSRGKKEDEADIEDKDNCGRFNFVFAGTVNKKDFGNYYAYKGKKIKTISQGKAEKWVRKYQETDKKRDKLKDTLTPADQAANCLETKHVYFEKDKVEELKTEIVERLKKDKGAGLKIKLVSYTDEKFIDDIFGAKVPQSYQQRLTIDFVFTDKDGNDVYLSEDEFITRAIVSIFNLGHSFIDENPKWDELFSPPFDRAKLNTILEELNRERYVNWKRLLTNFYTMDTGVPAPPPPNADNMAALDSEI